MKQSNVIELITPEDWQRAHEALLSLRPKMSLETFLGNRAFCLQEGYRLFGLEVDGIIVAVAGITMRPHLVFKKQLEIDDLATHRDHQRKGHGLSLVNYLIEFAKINSCNRIKLFSSSGRNPAHMLYEKAGMENATDGYRFELQFPKTNP